MDTQLFLVGPTQNPLFKVKVVTNLNLCVLSELLPPMYAVYIIEIPKKQNSSERINSEG